MWTIDRIAKTVADVTVGTVIVFVHVALADREADRSHRPPRRLATPNRDQRFVE
jgi:hypothetical protein